MVADQVLNILS